MAWQADRVSALLRELNPLQEKVVRLRYRLGCLRQHSARIAQMLNDSAKAVRDAVQSRVEAGRGMDIHYDHPILLLQHMLWHEGYHHGQIKLALKVSGSPLLDEAAGPLTWDIWMRKSR